MEEFDAANLAKNAQIFDKALEDYLQEYVKLGMEPVRYDEEERTITKNGVTIEVIPAYKFILDTKMTKVLVSYIGR